jgi:DNA-binding NarL/FixJ family response regulator
MCCAATSGLRGRGTEWRATLGFLDSAAAGQGAVLLVEGAQGTGKSRLLTATEETAARRGFVCARIRTDQPADLDEVAAQFTQAAARRPTLITVEDRQAADRSTVAALRALPAWLVGLPVGWAMVRRQDRAGPVTDWLFDEWIALGAIRIRLGPLPPPAVTEIVTEALDARPDDALLSLADGTGGNPGLLVALLDGLREEKAVAISNGSARLLSARPLRPVEETIDSWLRALSPSARNLLEVSALMEGPFTADQVALLMGYAPAELEAALDEAVSVGLLKVVGDRTMVFHHALVQESVARRVPEAVRATLRRQTARAGSRPAQPPPQPSRVAAGARVASERAEDSWDRLTGPERTVAELVAQGLSNRQAAERIFLSPHTVSFHLRKVYRKLGISSRVELTRITIERERAGLPATDPVAPPAVPARRGQDPTCR